MAAAIGLNGTKILRVRDTTLRIQRLFQREHKPHSFFVFATLKKYRRIDVIYVMAVVRVLYETEIVRRNVHSNGWCNFKGGKYDTREPEVQSWPPTRESIGVCDAYKQMRRCGAIPSSISDSRLGPDSRARQAERTSARAAGPAIGQHRRFRDATGRRNGAKAADGYAYSGGGPNSREPEDK